jgi:MFS family permease
MITTALLLAMMVTALEQTVVSTAMPSIIAQLRGIDIYPWVFSAYLLAATVSTPIYGKLADILGRKRVLLFGLGLFAVGSMLSGLSTSMPMLIAMRVLQGLGAGAVGPIVLTLLGDLFTLQERARMQGLFSAVWGASSLIGPAVGGILTDQLSWRWVFFVTVPFGVFASWLLVRHYHEDLVHHKETPPIDWWGVALLTLGTTVLLMAVLDGRDHSKERVAAMLLVAVGLLGAFLWQERRAADPILPLDLVFSPHIAAAIVGSFLIGALLFGIDTYLPLFVQGVRGGTATAAGRVITPLFLAWAVSVAIAAKVVVHLGFRWTAVVGSLFITAGSLALAIGVAWPSSSRWLFPIGMVIVGLGMGPTSLSYILSVQYEVQWNRRGVATSAVTFVRTMGGALGVGILGAVLGFSLARALAAGPGAGIDVAAALRPETHRLLSGVQLHAVREALGHSLRGVFFDMFGIAIFAILVSFGVGGGGAHGAKPASTEEPDPDALILAVGAEH